MWSRVERFGSVLNHGPRELACAPPIHVSITAISPLRPTHARHHQGSHAQQDGTATTARASCAEHSSIVPEPAARDTAKVRSRRNRAMD